MPEFAPFRETVLANGYELVDGVEMNRRFGDRFAIVNQWFKKHVSISEFVEIRIDSDRFSAHPDAEPGCPCELCGEEVSKPILSHEQPVSLLAVPPQEVPSRGWGEEFWVKVTERDDSWLRGVIGSRQRREEEVWAALHLAGSVAGAQLTRGAVTHTFLDATG